MKKKDVVVFLDVDDVLLSFKRMFNRHLREVHKIKVSDDHVASTWLYEEEIPKGLRFDDMMATLPPKWAGQLKALKGAREFTQALKKMGCRIVCITHIFGHQGPERIACLTKQGIHFDEIYFTMGRNKSDFSKAVIKRYPKARTYLLDDKAENVVDFLENMPNSKGITMDLPFNQDAIARYKKKGKKNLDSTSLDHQGMYSKLLKELKKI